MTGFLEHVVSVMWRKWTTLFCDSCPLPSFPLLPLCGLNGSLGPHAHLCVVSGILKPTSAIFGRLMVEFSLTVDPANVIDLRGGVSFNCSEICAGTNAEVLCTRVPHG